MPKVNLTFKGRLIDSYHLGEEETTIGRDNDCSIVIDSLAIAPKHLVIKAGADGYSVTALDEEYPLLLNQQKIETATVEHGDVLQIGKHTIDFIDDTVTLAVPESNIDETPLLHEDEEEKKENELTGLLQILSGENIGRIIPLNRTLIRIGRTGAECVVIAHRDNGYYMSYLEGNNPPKINQTSIGDQTYKLNNGDLIEIGRTQMTFQDMR